MTKAANSPVQHCRPATVPPIAAHIFRPQPVQPKAQPQPQPHLLVGILAELASIGNY